jgi:hypothetical protein
MLKKKDCILLRGRGTLVIFLWKDNMNRIIDAAFRTYAKEEKAFLGSKFSENKEGFKALCKMWDEEVVPHFATAVEAGQTYRVWLTTK